MLCLPKLHTKVVGLQPCSTYQCENWNCLKKYVMQMYCSRCPTPLVCKAHCSSSHLIKALLPRPKIFFQAAKCYPWHCSFEYAQVSWVKVLLWGHCPLQVCCSLVSICNSQPFIGILQPHPDWSQWLNETGWLQTPWQFGNLSVFAVVSWTVTQLW